MIKDEIHFLITTFTFLSTLLVVLLIYLLFRKTIENRQRQKVGRFKSKMNDKMLHSILTGDFVRSLQADSNVKKIAMEELLSHYAEVLEGAEEKNNLIRLAENRLLEHYRKSLKSMKWSTRMNALFHVEAFGIAGLKEDIVNMLNRRRVTKEEKIRALAILSQFQAEQMFELLTRDYNDLSHLEYRNILSRLEGKGFDLFILGYHSCQVQLKFAILDIVSLKKDLSYLNFTETVFSFSSGEEKVRSLKALVSIGHVRKLDKVLALFHSVNWEERMLAGRLAGVMKVESALPDLVQLLQDPSWWVRTQAGQSIMMFPQGKKLLQDVVTSSDDSFARDMAWEWINKGVYHT
jgi:hypothetical protein